MVERSLTRVRVRGRLEVAARQLVEGAVEQVGDVAGIVEGQPDLLCLPMTLYFRSLKYQVRLQ